MNKNNAVHAIVFEAVAVAISLEEPELMAMGVALLAKFLSVRGQKRRGGVGGGRRGGRRDSICRMRRCENPTLSTLHWRTWRAWPRFLLWWTLVRGSGPRFDRAFGAIVPPTAHCPPDPLQ